MKTMVKDYVFNPASRTITVKDYPSFKLEELLLVTNVTKNIIIYNFADPSCGGSLANNVLTLLYNTSAMSSSDSLQIYLDIDNVDRVNEQYPLKETYTYDINMNSVLGSQPLYEGDKVKAKISTSTVAEVRGRIGSSNEELSLDCAGAQSVTLQLSGTWAGTIAFECSANGGDFQSIVGVRIYGIDYATTTTANAIWQFNVSGLRRFRVRYSTYTSGTAIVHINANSGLSRLSNVAGVLGSQSQLLAQRASTYELNTYDTNLFSVLGNVKLWRDGLFTYDYPIAPTINPAQPAVVDNKFAFYPQKLPRLRVEVGEAQRLPLAQEANTNKLLVSDDSNRRLLEEILIQLQTLNKNFMLANANGMQSSNIEVK